MAANNANVPAELWGQHVYWKTLEAYTRYVKSDTEHFLSVSRAAMGLPKTPAPVVRSEDESAGASPEMVEEGKPLGVVGVPYETFSWS